MQPDPRTYLYEIARASDLIVEFTSARGFDHYERDAMLRSAVERQFEIIGEAVSRLARLDPELAGRIPEHRRVIAFRNILIHGYAQVDDRLVWDVVQSQLPALRDTVAALLAEQTSAEDQSQT